jgi:3-oxoacyl-[acyl-carrier-protein] synthase II
LDIGMGLELFDMKDLIRFINSSSPVSSDPRPEKDFLQTPADWCSSLIEKQWVLGLPSIIHISACAAATDALGHGFLRIRCGQARMIIAGGTDSMINPLGLGGFCKLQALSSRNETPQSASRPFDLHRDGFVLGEGAGFLILENLDDARSRNSRIYGEIVGYGNSFDAHAITEPHPQGYGAFLAMKRALQMAAIDPEQISYINAHGTSTPKNDRAETLAIKTLFAKHAYHIPVSSSKSMIGHLISAAGAVEVIASLICAQLNMIHPTINLDSPDPELDLDYVPQKARAHKISYFLSNSFAFGGMNATVVIKNGGLDA